MSRTTLISSVIHSFPQLIFTFHHLGRKAYCRLMPAPDQARHADNDLANLTAQSSSFSFANLSMNEPPSQQDRSSICTKDSTSQPNQLKIPAAMGSSISTQDTPERSNEGGPHEPETSAENQSTQLLDEQQQSSYGTSQEKFGGSKRYDTTPPTKQNLAINVTNEFTTSAPKILLKLQFTKALVRLDLWRDHNLDYIMPRLGAQSWQFPQYEKLPAPHRHFVWSLFVFLDVQALRDNRWELADVVDELKASFPDLLIVRRFAALKTSAEHDILQICVKNDCLKLFTGLTESGQALKDFITEAVSSLPEPGHLALPLGDPDTFWGKHKPDNYNHETLVLVPCFAKFLESFPQLPETVETPDMAVATASCEQQDLKLFTTSDGLVDAEVCMACRELVPVEDVVSIGTDDAGCCMSCSEKLFDECTACMGTVHKPEAVHMTCEHLYCPECLIELFRSGTSDLSNFPPKCCDESLAIHDFVDDLPHEVLRDYINMHQRNEQSEWTLCATPECQASDARILPSLVKDDWALCDKCLDLTCTRCSESKGKHTVGDEVRVCPKESDEAFLKLAEDEKWRACPKCHAMVSRGSGCNDMRCRCGQKFCYTCGTTYAAGRTCSCPMTFEDRERGGHAPVGEVDDAELGPQTVLVRLSRIARMLRYQMFLSQAGNPDAQALLQALFDDIRALWPPSDDRGRDLVEFVHHLQMRIYDGRVLREHAEEYATVLRWEARLPLVTHEQCALTCPHANMRRVGMRDHLDEIIVRRCQGCLQHFEILSRCIICSTEFCRSCEPENATATGQL